MKKEELREFSYAEAVHEIKQYLGYLKKNCAEDRLTLMKKEMRELENPLSQSLSAEDQERIDIQIKELLSQFNDLSAELKDTDF
jgi:signal transduction histidine kinase